jgi:hypothetical protein
MSRIGGTRPDQGELRLITPANPGAGADLAVTVPSGGPTEWWKVLAITFQLVTSATVANRNMRFTCGEYADQCAAINVPASTTVRYKWYAGAPNTDAALLVLSGVNYYNRALPSELLLFNGATIGTAIINIQAADQISAVRILAQVWRVHI